MTGYFFITFLGLVLVELTKGLSANGTPPVLQRFSWQMDLAYFMWSNIVKFRIALFVFIGFAATQIQIENIIRFSTGVLLCAALWGGIYWLFNKFWVGKFKFLPITQKTFLNAEQNFHRV